MHLNPALCRPGTGRPNSRANCAAYLALCSATLLALVALPVLPARANQFPATVRSPDGTPAEKATVVMADAQTKIEIINGDIVDCAGEIFRRQTDSAGRVALASHNVDIWLVVVHPSGFAQVKYGPKTLPATIPLAPWARVEGTYRVARKPQSHVSLELMRGLTSPPLVFPNGSAKTDANGRFVFERVAAGRVWVSRKVAFANDQGASQPASDQTLFTTLIAGKTTHLDFGANGRRVTGKLQRAADSRGSLPWTIADINVTPAGPRGSDRIFFLARADRDGNFCIEDVPTGDYFLNVRFLKSKGEPSTRHRFSVPAVDKKLSLRPVDLGVLTLKADNAR